MTFHAPPDDKAASRLREPAAHQAGRDGTAVDLWNRLGTVLARCVGVAAMLATLAAAFGGWVAILL